MFSKKSGLFFSYQTPPPSGGKIRESLIATIVQKAEGDKAFGLQVIKSPSVALSSYKLTSIEITEVVRQIKQLAGYSIWPVD